MKNVPEIYLNCPEQKIQEGFEELIQQIRTSGFVYKTLSVMSLSF
jgi:hypothetical protein